MGLPGWMKCSLTPVRRDQKNIALEVSSGPLSRTMVPGSDRVLASWSSFPDQSFVFQHAMEQAIAVTGVLFSDCLKALFKGRIIAPEGKTGSLDVCSKGLFDYSVE